MTSKRWLRTMFLAAAATAAFALSGCGDDKPTNPGGNNTGDDFDETTAAAQASVAAPQAAALAQSITSIADGMGAKDGTYDWNAETMRWEYHYVYSGAGYDYDWTYTAQLALSTPAGARIKAIATDVPGNEGSMETIR